MSDKARQEIRFEGAGVSPGIAFGKIHVARDDLDDVARYRISPSQVPDEIGRFEAALIGLHCSKRNERGAGFDARPDERLGYRRNPKWKRGNGMRSRGTGIRMLTRGL